MGTMLAQLAVGMVMSKVAQKWGSKSVSTPQVSARDIVPATQATAPEAAQLGGDNPATKKRNREALIIQPNTTNTNTNYNPMNM